MGSKEFKDLDKKEYQASCEAIKQILLGQKNVLKIEDTRNKIKEKFDDKAKKAIILDFIKTLMKNEKKDEILKKMEDIFIKLYDKYDQIHRKDEDPAKKFSEPADDDEKNLINAIYISKIFEDDIDEDIKIHEYAAYLYDDEDAVKEIEEGKNKNIDEDFKNYVDDEKLEPTEPEKNEKFNELCKEKGIDPDKYDKPESTSSITEVNTETNKNSENNNQGNLNNNQENIDFDKNLNKNTYSDEKLLDYYDIIFDIDSLENLKKNGWNLISGPNGYEKYKDKKDKKNTVVTVIGNKNKGKSFILAKLSGKEIPDGFNITTKGLSVIYPDFEDKNIIFLDTAGFEIPLCETEENFKFTTNNEKYSTLDETEKKNVSIKDYLTDDEKITQIMNFTRDRQNTDYFLQKFILNSADILLCIVNQLNLSDHKFLNRIQEENKDKKIFVIHNLKTFKKKEEVDEYIELKLLKLVTSKLQKGRYIKINDNQKNNKEEVNSIYYKQVFDEKEENKNREVIHLFMANDESEAGKFYNKSTLEFIKNQIIAFVNNKKFPIIEKVKEFLFNHSEEFFNEPLDNIDDIKIIENDDKKLLKYTNENNPYELKECYVDELGNANFIQSNYKPLYRAYKVKYKDDNGESNKLILDIEISGEVDIKDIENPEIVNKNRQNIITITGKRNLTKGNSNKTTTTIKSIADYKSSYFDNNNKMFNLRIYIPNEKCIIGNLYKRKFDKVNGLYRFIYNIQEKNEERNVNVEIDSGEDDDDYDV
jgi:hypothetical protein